jgi:hypothetical protein
VQCGAVIRGKIKSVALLRVRLLDNGGSELSRSLRRNERCKCNDQKNELANHAVIVVELRHP